MSEHRTVSVAGWIMIAAMMALALAACLQAFVFPLELELREGTVWLHVLAQRAGLSIYDHAQVAFVNQNHGPLDPLLKHWIATLLPFLTPAMVTRCFVVALPLGLWLALRRAANGNAQAALAWTFGLELLLLGLQPPHFLLGRSDPTALFLFALMLWAGGAREGAAAGNTVFARFFALAVLGALSLAANWRNFPAVGAVLVGFSAEALAATAMTHRIKAAGRIAGAIGLGLVAPFALIVAVQFHGDLKLYWRHFFGFFSAASGWGATRADAFVLFPGALVGAHWLLHLGVIGATTLALICPSIRVPRAMQAWVWLPLLALLWVACGVAYHLNHGGGGLHYYAAFYVLLAFHLARAIEWTSVAWPRARLALGATLVAGLPWTGVGQQCTTLARSAESARAFLQACRDAAGAPIYSEDYQLFKSDYRGELVDMGDEVFSVARTGYFGAAFTATAERAFAALEKNPPPFVITGGCGSPPLQALLNRDYAPALRVPYLSAPYAGPAQTLFRLKSGPPRSAP